MSRIHSIAANGSSFSARTGEVILDAALNQGVAFPHDCRAGRCGSCMAKVVRGVALGGTASRPGFIYACQARALADLELQFETLPPVQSTAGRVTSLVVRGVDVVEVGLRLAKPIVQFPGQYCTFQFRGFPQRSFSPTTPADGSRGDADMTLHVKRVRGGRVSAALGAAIRAGHRVRVSGPFGTAFHRPGRANRLVLAASGTGYAPILSVVNAALAEDQNREVVVVVGARTNAQLYMVDGLLALMRFPNVTVDVTAQDVDMEWRHIVKRGDPAEHLPALAPDDVVYAAGSPNMVNRIAKLAAQAGADFHSDPFEASGKPAPDGWLRRLLNSRQRGTLATSDRKAATAPLQPLARRRA